MQKRTMTILGFLLFEFCLVLPLVADQKPPVFFFGGKQFYAGMSKREAVALLSECCKLLPSADSDVEKQDVAAGRLLGHAILPKEEPPGQILGSIFFVGGRVERIVRPLDNEIDTSNDDVVGFARAIERALPPEANEVGTTVLVSVRHERMSNAESDVVSLSFPNGRAISFTIGTLDKPQADTHKRDFVILNESLDPPGR